MADSLKDENKLPLFGLIAANLACFYALSQNATIIAGNWVGLVRNFGDALPAGLGLALVGILNAQFSPQAKARVVFWRWNNPLPGCEAFTLYAKNDPRVDLAALEQSYGCLPTEPREQNTLWYKLYKTVESEPSVIQAHRSFLFTRDYTCLALMMLVVLSIAGFIKFSSAKIASLYLAVLFLQLLISWIAARNNGKRFVTTVLALSGLKRKREASE